MRVRTFVAIALLMFALPALAADVRVTRAERAATHRVPETCVCFEVRMIRVPAGVCEQAGLKLGRDVVLSEAEFKQLTVAVQGCRDASVMQFPKVTADDGQLATVRNCEKRDFVTSIEAMKVKGETVFVPKNSSIELGDTLTLCGRVCADQRSVSVQASLKRMALAGPVELTPVVTQITPIFEGGSRGQPVPFTQYLQVPEVKTQTLEKKATIPSGTTLVLGGWKETAEPKAERAGRGKLLVKKAKPAEFEVVVLATVRVLRDEQSAAPAPMPHLAGQPKAYYLKYAAATDAAKAIDIYLRGKNLPARFVVDVESNTVIYSADAAVQERIRELLTALDKEPTSVVVSAMVVQVPRGFAEKALNVGGVADAKSWTLSPREMHMFTELLRHAKEREQCDILARPMIQVADGQTGHIQLGQQGAKKYRGAGAEGAATAAGVVFESLPVALSLQVTPRVSPDGRSLRLITSFKLTGEQRVTLTTNSDGGGQAGRIESATTLRAAAEMHFGETLILAASRNNAKTRSITGAIKSDCGEKYETLIILTPAMVPNRTLRVHSVASDTSPGSQSQ